MNWTTYDLFKQPVRLFLKRRDKKGFQNFKGSIYGTLMSFALFGICIYYFTSEYGRMMNFEYDD